jgi:pimeloyl-ACP methyl ester carboxylesterase
MLAASPEERAPTLPVLFAGDPPQRFVRLLKEIAADSRPESLEMQLCVIADTGQRDLLRRVASPKLLIWGEHDARSPMSIASEFEAAIPDATQSEGRVPRGRCSRPNVVPRSEPVASSPPARRTA